MKYTKESFRLYLAEQVKKLMEIGDEDIFGNDYEEELPAVDGGLGNVDVAEPGAEEAEFDAGTAVAPAPEKIDGINSSAIQAGEFEKVSQQLSAMASNLNPNSLAQTNLEISNILRTGRSKMVHINTMEKKMKEFNYLTTAVATIFPFVSETEKSNIRNYIFVAFTPHISHEGSLRASPFAQMVTRYAGIDAKATFSYMKNVNNMDYMEYVEDGIYRAVMTALKNFQPNRGKSFFNFMLSTSVQATKTIIRDKRSYVKNKERVYNNDVQQFLEDPIGDENEEGATKTIGDTVADMDDEDEAKKETAKEIANAIWEYLKAHVKNPIYVNYFEDFAILGLTSIQMSHKRNISINSLRQVKARLNELLNTLVKDGRLEKYITATTGNEFHFPKNGFSLSNMSTEDKEDVENDTEAPEAPDETAGEEKLVAESFKPVFSNSTRNRIRALISEGLKYSLS